jgi:hypothetical protein
MNRDSQQYGIPFTPYLHDHSGRRGLCCSASTTTFTAICATRSGSTQEAGANALTLHAAPRPGCSHADALAWSPAWQRENIEWR